MSKRCKKIYHTLYEAQWKGLGVKITSKCNSTVYKKNTILDKPDEYSNTDCNNHNSI
jgi:hypothetical protein